MAFTLGSNYNNSTYTPITTTTGSAGFTMSTNVYGPNHNITFGPIYSALPCGCQIEVTTFSTSTFRPYPREQLQLKCFGCDKLLCNNCAIINRTEVLAGIWSSGCEDVGKTIPLT